MIHKLLLCLFAVWVSGLGLIQVSQASSPSSRRYQVTPTSAFEKRSNGKSILCGAVSRRGRTVNFAIKLKKGGWYERLSARNIANLRARVRSLTGLSKEKARSRLQRVTRLRAQYDALCAQGSDGQDEFSSSSLGSITPSSGSKTSASRASTSSSDSIASVSSSSTPSSNHSLDPCFPNQICETGETPENCSIDCGCNNNRICEPARGESAQNCINDCYHFDSDADGLPDGWELVTFGNLDQSALDDPSFSWHSNIDHYRNGTDPFSVENNLVQNPGFEGGADGSGIPLHWLSWGHGGTKQIDTSVYHFGQSSWKWTRRSTDNENSARSDFIAVDPSKTYMLVGFVKSETGSEKVTLRWDEFSDANDNAYLTSSGYAADDRAVQAEWSALIHMQQLYCSGRAAAPCNGTDTKFVKLTMLFDNPSAESRSVWWDDLALYEFPPEQLKGFPCENTENARCLEFGQPTPPGIEFNEDVLGELQHEGEIAYRPLLALKTLNLSFDAFNAGEHGLPLSAMYLEIKYKDTLDDSLYQSSDSITEHRAMLSSNIDFINDLTVDPDYEMSSNERKYVIAGLGRTSDQQWKYIQYGLQKSPFQLIRAVDGKYRFSIVMPNLGPEDAQLALPIEYISLRAINDRDYASLAEHQWRYRYFYPASMKADRPFPQINYEDHQLTVFSRDLMRPIFPYTQPKETEVASSISALAARDDIATLNFGLFSQDGINGLTFAASDLIESGSGQHLDAASVSISKIVYTKHITWASAYATLPDYLDDASPMDIAPQTSPRVWIKVNIGSSAAAGTYRGNITISRLGVTLKNVQLAIEVLPLTLDSAAHANIVYGYPYYGGLITENIDEAFRVYREAQLQPYALPITRYHYPYDFTPDIAPIYDSNWNITGYDLSKFERHMQRMKDAGFIRDQMILEPVMEGYVYWWAKHESPWTPESERWNHFSDPVFKEAYGLLIQSLMESAASFGVDLLFEVSDEPGVNISRRVMTDRIFRIIQEYGGKTTVTYYANCDDPLPNPQHLYGAPDPIPALTPYVTVKVWTPPQIGEGYQRSQNDPPGYFYGYYTTSMSTSRNPIDNRFVHGLLALRNNAKVVSAYAMSSWRNDPFNGMDPTADYRDNFFYTDFLYAYPSWDGRLLETMGYEGLRLGIRDARIAATLRRLTSSNPQHPAIVYLNNQLAKLSPDYWNDYALRGGSDQGFHQEILRSLSPTSDPDDYEAYSAVSATLMDYLKQLAN